MYCPLSILQYHSGLQLQESEIMLRFYWLRTKHNSDTWPFSWFICNRSIWNRSTTFKPDFRIGGGGGLEKSGALDNSLSLKIILPKQSWIEVSYDIASLEKWDGSSAQSTWPGSTSGISHVLLGCVIFKLPFVSKIKFGEYSNERDQMKENIFFGGII